MPIASDGSSLRWYLSGGATNANPNLSLGGARSSVAITLDTLNNLFDDVTGDEAAAGQTEYRCVYWRNEDADATGAINPTAWIANQPYDPDPPYTVTGETIAIGMESVQAAIATSSVAAATVITCAAAHGLATGATVVIAGHTGSTPSINGTYVATVTGPTTFTIPVNVTVGGTGGTVAGAGTKNAVAQVIALPATAPNYVVFSAPSAKATGLVLSDGPYIQNDYHGIWVKRITPSSQAYSASTKFAIGFEVGTV